MIHCDIWGKFSVPDYKGFQYFLIVVDDFSRCTWIFLMTHKSETYSLVKHFLILVKTQFNSSVKTIRSDNSTEFCSNDTIALFSSLGIIHQTSCVYTPHQNGVVERKHRHLLEVSRTLRFQASLPIKFWSDCVLTATHLINRMPSTVLNDNCPIEVL